MRHLALFVVVGFGCGGAGASAPSAPGPKAAANANAAAAAETFGTANAERAAELAADYIVAHTDERGRFAYEVRHDGSRKDDYNVLRHAGTIYALAQQYRRAPSAEVKRTLLSAASHLLSRYVGPVKGASGSERLLAVWSLPGEEVEGARVAKLGGAGLGLVALASARTLDPTAVPIATLRGLGQFVLHMQKPGGEFHNKWVDGGSFDDDFVSLYYPGEAILGLVMLYEIDRDNKWLAAAIAGTAHLVRSRKGATELPADHWLLIAIERLLTVLPADASGAVAEGASREAILGHAFDLASSIMAEQRAVAKRRPRNAGGFERRGKSTPTATRLEGLLALYRALPPDDGRRAELRKSIDAGVTFLLRCQVTAGKRRGGVVWACPDPPPEPGTKKFAKARAVRMDYVQHALSAWVGFLGIAE